jgi:hypothetical protein
VAGLNAYAKGKRLGLFEPSSSAIHEKRRSAQSESFEVELMNRAVPVLVTAEGIRALSKGKPTNPHSVESYLASKFGDHLAATERAMTDLATSMPSQQLAQAAFKLYEKFRPDIPQGVEGWGAAGELRLTDIRRAAMKLA